MLFFLSNLPIFYVLNATGVQIGIPFYLWLGTFNLMALPLWAFANDLLLPKSRESGSSLSWE